MNQQVTASQPVKEMTKEDQALAASRQLVAAIKSDKMQEQLRDNLPPNIDLDAFTAAAVTAINMNPDLLLADRPSFYNALQRAAADGLLPDGQDGILNVYNTNAAPKGQPARWIKKVQWQRMVGGVIKQFAKAGISVYAVSVYANDKIEAWNDEAGQHIKHVPVLFGDKGARIGALAVAANQGIYEAMDVATLDRARAASKSGDSGPWKTWPERMEQKSALHRLRKRVAVLDPAAEDVLKALDDEFEDDKPEPGPAVTTATQRPQALQQALASPEVGAVDLSQVATAGVDDQAEPLEVSGEANSQPDDII
jgi:recombination protein RecT